MIDGLLKTYIDPLWEKAAMPLVRIGMTPNQVTAAGMGLILLASGFYLYHQSNLIFGLTLAVAFAFDALDGAVARVRDMRTKAGGYFDAIVDRYQELLVLAAIAWVADIWAVAMFALTGGLFTTYAKARVAIEIPISNEAWPDLFERLERIIFLCALLVADGIAKASGFSWPWLLTGGLVVYAVLTHATALQRIRRGFMILRAHQESER